VLERRINAKKEKRNGDVARAVKAASIEEMVD
jgi:hypothetical protein